MVLPFSADFRLRFFRRRERPQQILRLQELRGILASEPAGRLQLLNRASFLSTSPCMSRSNVMATLLRLGSFRFLSMARRIRASGSRLFPAAQVIRSIKLYHRQAYAYAYHRPKLEFVRTGSLDDKRKGDTRFAALADFLEAIPTRCPHDLFPREDDPKARASQAHPAFADVSRIIVNRKENAATHTAGLIIPAVGNNKLRHETLQRFAGTKPKLMSHP